MIRALLMLFLGLHVYAHDIVDEDVAGLRQDDEDSSPDNDFADDGLGKDSRKSCSPADRSARSPIYLDLFCEDEDAEPPR